MLKIDDKDYWVIVSISEDNEIYILKASKDLEDDEFLECACGTFEYNSISTKWADDLDIGIYKVELEFEKDDDGDFEDFTITTSTPLFTP